MIYEQYLVVSWLVLIAQGSQVTLLHILGSGSANQPESQIEHVFK